MENSIFNYWFYILPSFILGSIPSGYLLVKILFKKDIRQFGSKNIGSTNVGRTFGSKYGYITLFLDMLKGYLGVFISYNLLTSKYILLENTKAEEINLIISLLPLFAVLGAHISSSIFCIPHEVNPVARRLGILLDLPLAVSLLQVYVS